VKICKSGIRNGLPAFHAGGDLLAVGVEYILPLGSAFEGEKAVGSREAGFHL